jgi:hypothetical protein
MNTLAILLLAWFALGILCVLFSLWFMRTHEKELMEDIPEAQIFGCIPPPIQWGVILFMLCFGPLAILWTIGEAIRDARKEKDENAPDKPPVAATEIVIAPQTGWMVLFGLIGAALIAFEWAWAFPAKPLDEFWEVQGRSLWFPLFLFGLSGAMGRGKPYHGLREPLYFLPLYFVGQVPQLVSFLGGWPGGWILGIAGALVGAGAGAAAGWLFNRWALPEMDKPPPSKRVRAILLPIMFAVLLGSTGAVNWGVEWVTPEHAWVIGVGWLLLALTGALVGRPFLGLLVMSPFALILLVPLLGSITVGWEGGWIPGIVGGAVGAVAGAVKGWLFNRWIMPEYDKRRERERAAKTASPTNGPRLGGPTAERS